MDGVAIVCPMDASGAPACLVPDLSSLERRSRSSASDKCCENGCTALPSGGVPMLNDVLLPGLAARLADSGERDLAACLPSPAPLALVGDLEAEA